MAKVNVKVNFVEKYFPAIAKVAADDLTKKAAEVGERLIKGKTRSGNQLVDGNSIRKQPALSPAWVETRSKLASTNETHAAFSPRRSNLTFTGQLIDALTSKRMTSGRIGIQFFVNASQRAAYNRPDGRGRMSSAGLPNNQQLAGYLADQGREFVGLDQKSRTQINNELTRILRRRLKVLLK